MRLEIIILNIRIREVLQGKISDTLVQVSFNPYYICPAPARYSENTVLALRIAQHLNELNRILNI